MNGGSPVSISYSTTPSAYTSERAVISRSPIACSGDHVVRRAERHAGLGHPIAAGLARRQGDAEVGHQRLTVVEQDVLGLDVAVDHAVPVGVVERARHLDAIRTASATGSCFSRLSRARSDSPSTKGMT